MNAPRASQAAVLFAGGGTGGHIFPALAIREELGARQPGIACSFLCSQRLIDASILSNEKAEFEALPAKPFGVRPLTLVRFLSSWGPSIRQTRAAIRTAREQGHPVVLVAMGGFVAAPAAQAARAERTETVLINLDAVPGKANRWIARRVARRLSAATGPAVPEAWERIPPIVRSSSLTRGEAPDCRKRLGLEPDHRTLLVTGGSQGARSINELMMEVCRSHPAWLEGWQVLHQSGEGADPALADAYSGAGVEAKVVPFIEDMGSAWGGADLAIARSGAGNVGEAWANAVPSVFLPYPYHRDQHQRLNAIPLTDAGSAIVVNDLIGPRETLGASGDLLSGVLTEADRRAAMRAAGAHLGPADGASRAAEAILGALGRCTQ